MLIIVVADVGEGVYAPHRHLFLHLAEQRGQEVMGHIVQPGYDGCAVIIEGQSSWAMPMSICP